MKKIITLLITVILFCFISCSSNEQTLGVEQVEIINKTTKENAAVTFTTVKINAEIKSNNLSSVSSRGVCWSTNPNPTVENNIATAVNNTFSYTIINLIANTKYYYRIFATTTNGVVYSSNETFTTLTLENTIWKFATYYPPGLYSTGITIYSRVDFYENNTTKFDEIGVGQGYMITYGTWTLNGNTLTYLFEGSDTNNSTYVYTGVLNGMTMNGAFTHPQSPGTWTAAPLN